jgi:hypothetical protein
MADRLSWWVIPGALVILARVVTLGSEPQPATHEPVPATAIDDPVVLQDASGRRSDVLSWSELTASALVLAVPQAQVGGKATVTLWRRIDGRREAKPWFEAPCQVRDDGTISIAGLPAGAYDAQVALGVGGDARSFAASAIQAPGRVTMAAAPATPVR